MILVLQIAGGIILGGIILSILGSLDEEGCKGCAAIIGSILALAFIGFLLFVCWSLWGYKLG